MVLLCDAKVKASILEKQSPTLVQSKRAYTDLNKLVDAAIVDLQHQRYSFKLSLLQN